MAAFATNITLQADFEGTADAVSKGRKISPTFFKDSIGMFDEGVAGKAIKLGPWQNMPTPGTTEMADRVFGYEYGVKDSMSSRRGAVSFWVKPVDWDGKAATNHRLFCSFFSSDGHCQLTLYKVLSEPSLFVHFRNGTSRSSIRLASIEKWANGEWHNIILCWDNGTYCAFMDGVMIKSGVYAPFEKDFATMRLGSMGWRFEVGATLMDELRIFDAPLSLDDAKAIFNKTLNITQASRDLSLAKTAPKVDGAIQPNEYPFTGIGFMTVGGIGLSERQARYSLGHDGKRLYLAMDSPIQSTPKYVKERARDSELWEDEGVEWHLYVPGRHQFQFIVNPDNGIYDSLDRNPAWNSNSFESKSIVKDGRWIFECSMSLEELECTDGKVAINICRAFREPKLDTCIVGVKRNMGFADRNAFITLHLMNNVRPALSLDEFSIEPNKLALAISSDAPFDATVTCSKGLEHIFEEKYSGRKFNLKSEKFLGGASIVVSVRDGETTLYQNEFAMGDDTDKPLTLHFLYTELDKEEIVLKCSSFYPDSSRGTLRLSLKDLKGNEVAGKDYPLKGLGMSFDLKYPGGTLPYGYYSLTGTYIAQDGSETTLFNEDWCRPEKHQVPDYLSTDNIKVQKPWTPLVQKGSRIDALIKSYEFNDAFLLSKVTANGNNILGAPMRLEVNGKSDCKTKPAVFDNHGDFCFITQEADYGGVKVTTRSRMDYDGLVKVTMTITPPEGGCDLSSLKLVMPFDNATAQYVNGNGQPGGESGQSGVLTEKQWNENLFGNYAFWIGNTYAGFSFVVKNTKGWHCWNATKSLELKPEGNLRTAYINIVDIPFKLDKPRTIEFGIMASPCRPESIKVNRMLHTDWVMWWLHAGKYFDYIDPNYTKPRPAGKSAFPYNSIGTSAHCPHWNYYQQDWNCRGLGSFVEDHPVKNQAARDRAHWVFGCLNSQSFMDFKLEQILNAINNEKMDIHNLYFDLVAIHSCSSEHHGCVWKDDFGRKWESNDWECRRAFFQIIRKALLERTLTASSASTRTTSESPP